MAATAIAMTLEEAIEQQITLGQKNPHAVFGQLERLFGEDLSELARPYIADLVSEMARQKINALRRADVAKITPGSVADSKIMLRSLWVPAESGITYKRIADMTADDFEARAGYLDRMIIGITRHAEWCRAVAKKIRRTKAGVAGNLKSLPALPEIDDVERKALH